MNAVASLRPAVLVIAGVDSSGGAGLTRDVRTLAEYGVEPVCAVTAVTAQSSSQVIAVQHVAPEIVRAQIAGALATRPVAAIKIGMLGTAATVDAVADSLAAATSLPIILDPVLVASSGGILLDDAGRDAMRTRLFPRATLVTPNIPETAALLREATASCERDLLGQAQRLLSMGARAVLLKGGHATNEAATDYLVSPDSPVQRFVSPRVDAARRGTGCALASAIAAGLAFGMPLSEACQSAKQHVFQLISSG